MTVLLPPPLLSYSLAWIHWLPWQWVVSGPGSFIATDCSALGGHFTWFSQKSQLIRSSKEILRNLTILWPKMVPLQSMTWMWTKIHYDIQIVSPTNKIWSWSYDITSGLRVQSNPLYRARWSILVPHCFLPVQFLQKIQVYTAFVVVQCSV